uniref:Uncharacterized protein n=1 Tax=Pipistrellus kuhlii TaxID=59472 RepID=A0A7J7XV31_PIPKU|nr:hypothetical protein mPipKuh1_010474 [Pipistrellus kuhlii]
MSSKRLDRKDIRQRYTSFYCVSFTLLGFADVAFLQTEGKTFHQQKARTLSPWGSGTDLQYPGGLPACTGCSIPSTACAFFPSTRTFSRISHVRPQNKAINLRRNHSIFPDHNGMKLEINYKTKTHKSVEIKQHATKQSMGQGT